MSSLPSLFKLNAWFNSVQFSSLTQLCPTFCDPMNCSTPGLPVYQQHPEFTQTHLHRVGDDISSSVVPSPPAPNPSQHQSFFQRVNSCMRWPKYWSFSYSIIPSKEHPGPIFRMDWLDLLASPRDSQESSPTPQFKSINSLALIFLHSPTLKSIHDNRKNHSLD